MLCPLAEGASLLARPSLARSEVVACLESVARRCSPVLGDQPRLLLSLGSSLGPDLPKGSDRLGTLVIKSVFRYQVFAVNRLIPM